MSVQDDEAIYSLVGPSISEDAKNIYYPAILIRTKNRPREQRTYLVKIGSKVLIHSDIELPFIGEVRSLYKCKASKKLQFTTRWFYRPQDVQQNLGYTMDPNELCYSELVNTNDVVTIIAPCYVAFVHPRMPFPQWLVNQPEPVFACRYSVNPSKACRGKLGKMPHHPLTYEKLQQEYTYVYPSFPDQFKQILRGNETFWRQLTFKLGNFDKYTTNLDTVPVLDGSVPIVSLYDDIPRIGESSNKAMVMDQSSEEGENNHSDEGIPNEGDDYFITTATVEHEHDRHPHPPSSSSNSVAVSGPTRSFHSPSRGLLASPFPSQKSTQDEFALSTSTALNSSRVRHSLEVEQFPAIQQQLVHKKTTRALAKLYENRVWDGVVVEGCSGPLFELAVALTIQQLKYSFLVEQGNNNHSSVPSSPSSCSSSFSSRANVDGSLVIVHGDQEEVITEAIASSPQDPIGALKLLLRPKLRFWSLKDQTALHKLYHKTQQLRNSSISASNANQILMYKTLAHKSRSEVHDYLQRFVGCGKQLASTLFAPPVPLTAAEDEKKDAGLVTKTLHDSIATVREESLRATMYWSEDERPTTASSTATGSSSNNGKNGSNSKSKKKGKTTNHQNYQQQPKEKGNQTRSQAFLLHFHAAMDSFSLHQLFSAFILRQGKVIYTHELVSRVIHIFGNSLPNDIWEGRVDINQLTPNQAHQVRNNHEQKKAELFQEFRSLLTTERAERLVIALFHATATATAAVSSSNSGSNSGSSNSNGRR